MNTKNREINGKYNIRQYQKAAEIKIRKSKKDKQYNDQTKKYIRTNIDLQNIMTFPGTF